MAMTAWLRAPVDRTADRAGLFYRNFFAGQHLIDSHLEVVSFYLVGIAGAVVDGAVINQFAILIGNPDCEITGQFNVLRNMTHA